MIASYRGFTPLEDTIAMVQAYAAHPDYAPGQKVVFDLRGVTRASRDFVRYLDGQARAVEVLGTAAHEQLVVMLADNPEGLHMAQRGQRAWAGVRSIVIVIVDNETEALDILGLPDTSLAALSAHNGVSD